MRQFVARDRRTFELEVTVEDPALVGQFGITLSRWSTKNYTESKVVVCTNIANILRIDKV